MTWGWEMASENVKSGYCEGLLRGYRGGLLTAADYNNLSQCENLDDVKLHLNTTDYAPYLANEPSPLHPATIVEKCTHKLVDEWNHLRCQARCIQGTKGGTQGASRQQGGWCSYQGWCARQAWWWASGAREAKGENPSGCGAS